MGRNHEVVTSQFLLDRNGQIREPGWSRSILQKYRRADIKAPKYRIKEWDYYLIQTEEFAVALTLSDLAYMGMISASFIDFTKAWEHTETVLTKPTMGRFELPRDSKGGISAYADERVTMTFEVENGNRHLICIFKKFDGAKDLPEKSWVRVTAEVKMEKFAGYQGEGPVLYANKVVSTKEPKVPVIDFAGQA